MMSVLARMRHRAAGLLLLVLALLLSSCGWHLSMAIPGGPGTGPGSPSTCRCRTLAIGGNSRVMVADVWVRIDPRDQVETGWPR